MAQYTEREIGLIKQKLDHWLNKYNIATGVNHNVVPEVKAKAPKPASKDEE